MAVPASSEARLFYRCAFQRYEEAAVLLRADYPTGAVYLAGYAIECILKALIITAVPAKNREEVVGSFRGAKAHRYEWLRSMYLTACREGIPGLIARHFTLVNSRSTDLRYAVGSIKAYDAVTFLDSTSAILGWADGRL